jgi:hypothetical protein
VAIAFKKPRAGCAKVGLECCNDMCKVYAPAGSDAPGLRVDTAPGLSGKNGGCNVLGVPIIGATAEASSADAVTSLSPEP